MAIEIGGTYYNVNISSEISREAARRLYEQKLNTADNVQSSFQQEIGFNPVKNKEIEDRLTHIVLPSVTKLSDIMADMLKSVREEKGAYDYKDIVNAAGKAYAKLYAEIEDRYKDTSVHYFKSDGTLASMEEEIAWLDDEFEAKIAWEKANAKVKAMWEKYAGKITEIPYQKIEQIADDFYEARNKYLEKI